MAVTSYNRVTLPILKNQVSGYIAGAKAAHEAKKAVFNSYRQQYGLVATYRKLKGGTYVNTVNEPRYSLKDRALSWLHRGVPVTNPTPTNPGTTSAYVPQNDLTAARVVSVEDELSGGGPLTI